ASGSFAAPSEAWWTDTWFGDGKGGYWPALNSGDQWLNGALCDVRIYNRVITGAEVSTLFSGGNVSSGLVGEYFAPTATSASANDQCGGGHNGRLNRSPARDAPALRG